MTTALLFLISLLISAVSTGSTAGENLYRRGILPSGAQLTGTRDAGESAKGTTAACVNCHRRSGMGTVEGRTVIPPVTPKYLFHPGLRPGPEAGSGHPGAVTPVRIAYTDATLARAIRQGIGPDGRVLDYLMPRYPLDDATMSALIGYLKNLSSGPVPGVTSDMLHFATIITPDADPVRRKGMLDVLEHFFAAKNEFYRGMAPPLQSSRRIHFRVLRRWQLHVWELTGEPGTWKEQLNSRLSSEPVFAVISGIGGKNWAPVHDFCQEHSLPCILPNVDLPVVAEDDFYSVYFSKGVLLEAQLIARSVRESTEGAAPRRVIQLYREDDIGASAAQSLCEELGRSGITTVERAIKHRASIREASGVLRNLRPRDVLVLWLRPEDLRGLPAAPVQGNSVYVSGVMGGLETAPLSRAWRKAARMTYPFELPERRATFMKFPLNWFEVQHIPVVAEQTQTDTYIACGILAENLASLYDDFVPDYLLERIEVMLSSKLVSGYYPSLGLAPGQRFASKGGYIVHFTDESGRDLATDGGWTVP